ncbi:hypothetical protein, partial [Bacteroides xylanisolvens]|uniref:hypothetical protein n=1 Tax=Bacteroides xylanisolvens TaxID=371601 RepID=UPI0019616B6C
GVFKVTKKQTYLQLFIGLRKKKRKTVEIKKRLPPNLTKNQIVGSSSNSVLVKLIERLMDKGISAY